MSEKPWTITGTNSADGNLSARSGAISHNATYLINDENIFPGT